jgi:methyltransferase
VILSAAVLALVTLQRIGEMALAQRNTARLKAQGAVEAGARHYPLIVALHAAWLAGLWLLAWNAPPNIALLVLFGVLQILRVWVIASLGRRWTTRILVLPGRPLVCTGPYRWLRHPNYAVVAAEIAVLPLAFGLVWYAVVFSAVNAGVLAIRIKAENEAIARYAEDRAGSD